jgi:hypothetical protein
MTDPSKQRLQRVFMFAAASDLLLGIVLAAVGLNQDEPVLTVVGVALALSGTAVTSWLIVRGSRPEQL